MLVFGVAVTLLPAAGAGAKQCLFLASSQLDASIASRIDSGLRRALDGNCQLRHYRAEITRDSGIANFALAALQVRKVIDDWRPTVVIVTDGELGSVLLERYYANTGPAFVFITDTALGDNPALRFSNTTGILVEQPRELLVRRARDLTEDLQHMTYLGPDTDGGRIDREEFAALAAVEGISMDSHLVQTVKQWIDALRAAQSSDVLILGSNTGIGDWHDAQVRVAVNRFSRPLIITNETSVMSYAMFGLNRDPIVLGRWGAEAVLAVLAGMPPAEIRLVDGRRGEYWINEKLFDRLARPAPRALLEISRQIR